MRNRVQGYHRMYDSCIGGPKWPCYKSFELPGGFFSCDLSISIEPLHTLHSPLCAPAYEEGSCGSAQYVHSLRDSRIDLAFVVAPWKAACMSWTAGFSMPDMGVSGVPRASSRLIFLSQGRGMDPYQEAPTQSVNPKLLNPKPLNP